MTICKEVENEIREAYAQAMSLGCNWTDGDHVGYICDREGLNIDSPEVNLIVFVASGDFELGIL